MKLSLLAVSLVALLASPAVAATTEQIREFDVVGVKLGTSYAKIESTFYKSRIDTLGPNGRRFIGRDKEDEASFEIEALLTSGVTRIQRETGYKVSTEEMIQALKVKYGEPDKQEHIESQRRAVCGSIGANPPDCRERDVLTWGNRYGVHLEITVYPQYTTGSYDAPHYGGSFKTILHDPSLDGALMQGKVYQEITPPKL